MLRVISTFLDWCPVKKSHADYADYTKTMQDNTIILLWKISQRHTLLRSYVAIRMAKHKRKRVLLCVLSLLVLKSTAGLRVIREICVKL